MPRKTKEANKTEKVKTKEANKTKKVKTKNIENLATTKKETKTTSKASKKSTKKENKTTTKKNSSNVKKKSDKKNTPITAVEYYDLPYRYNETVVKILAQTPKSIFVYWDISDEDREKYKKQFGENFFETSKPVLVVHNDSLNYSFEIEINDFANSWYLHVNDSKSNYRVELVRRLINNTDNNSIFITSSNNIESPNDHILFDSLGKTVFFRNVKTNDKSEKTIANLSFMKNMGKIYNIYDLYKSLYKNEDIEDIYNSSNPSSHTSSQF